MAHQLVFLLTMVMFVLDPVPGLGYFVFQAEVQRTDFHGRGAERGRLCSQGGITNARVKSRFEVNQFGVCYIGLDGLR